MSARRWIVHGQVQGVGFRWFVMREAKRLELGGFVRNLANGAVEVVYEGPETALDTLEHKLREGPPHAHVADVERLQVPVELNLPTSFDIR